MSQKGHEIAKIPEDIGKTDEEEDDVSDSSGSADGQKNGKNEVDEDNDQGYIRVDRQNDLLHRRTLFLLSAPGRSEANTPVRPRRETVSDVSRPLLIAGNYRKKKEENFSFTLRNLPQKVKKNFFPLSSLQEVSNGTIRIRERRKGKGVLPLSNTGIQQESEPSLFAWSTAKEGDKDGSCPTVTASWTLEFRV